MRIDDELLARCKTLAFSIAPELRQRPLYVVDLSLFDGLRGTRKGSVLGWAESGTRPDYAFRERIGSAWTDPGPIIALNGESITNALRPDAWPDAFTDAVFNVFLHEVAHLLPPPEQYPTRDFAELFDFPDIRERQELRRVEAESIPEPPPDSVDNCHGADFVRICIHLVARAQLAGYQIVAGNLFGESLYFIPEPQHWLLILLREVVEMRDAPFEAIVKTQPPAEFTRLWTSCLEFHKKRETIQERKPCGTN